MYDNSFQTIQKKLDLRSTHIKLPIHLNTQYMRNPTIITSTKWNMDAFLKILPCAKPFPDPLIYLIKARILVQNYKFSKVHIS